MKNDRPKQMMVFAVIESMDHYKKGTEVHYRLVKGTFGAGWGSDEGFQRTASGIFSTKEELLESLF